MRRPTLVLSTDGVGTKVLVALEAGRYDTVGEDLVNHSVNDILVHGATPLAFMDYIAGSGLGVEQIAGLVEGIARGCRSHGMALAGGETAQMPGLYRPGTYDLAGTIIGVVEEDAAIHGEAIRPGDVLLGYASSGLHTNGYTLARRIVFERLGLGIHDTLGELGRSVADVLLDVHRSYFRSVMPVVSQVHGLAHITGGGIPGNLVRILPGGCQAVVDPGQLGSAAALRHAAAGGRDLHRGDARRVQPRRGTHRRAAGAVRRRRPGGGTPRTVSPPGRWARSGRDPRRSGSPDPREIPMRAPLLFTALLLANAASASAQSDQCSSFGGTSRRICDAALDGTRAFHPVAGLLVSGGNPVLGTANTLAGLGSFSLTARVNAADVTLPDPSYDGVAGEVPSSEELYAPVPLLEGAAGLFQGLPSGLLSIDLLASAQLLPTDQVENLSVDEDARRIGDVALGFGYGVRVGILRDDGPLPAVSLSAMRRHVPRLAYGDLEGGDEFHYGLDLRATNLRLVASKQLAAFQLAAGLGWDRYTGDADVRLRETPDIPIEIELEESRTLAFVNAGVDLAAVSIVGEVGYQGGRDQELSTVFEDYDTTSGKLFAGLGLRLGF